MAGIQIRPLAMRIFARPGSGHTHTLSSGPISRKSISYNKPASQIESNIDNVPIEHRVAAVAHVNPDERTDEGIDTYNGEGKTEIENFLLLP